MTIEPAATATEQITGHSSRTATMAARPPRFLFVCAKRQPATPIRKLRLSFSSGLSPNNAKPSPAISQFGCYPRTKVKTGSTQRSAALLDQFEFSRLNGSPPRGNRQRRYRRHSPDVCGRSLARIDQIGLRERLRRSKVTTKDDGKP